MSQEWHPALAEARQPRPSGRFGAALANVGIPALLASTALTQWVASRLAYHPSLGWNLGGWYAPWDWIIWRAKAGQWPAARPTFDTLDQVLMLGACLAPAVLAWMLNMSKSKPKKHEGVHGTAKFAEPADLIGAGLLPAASGVPHRGWYLGMTEKGDYLRHQGPEPILVTGPTRCGKSQGPSLMNCLSGADESLIAYDIRGDLYEKSAGWRAAEGNRVLRWDMMAEHGAARWNPLAEIRLGTSEEFSGVANAIEIVADPSGEGLDNPRDHFPPVAADFLISLTLFVLYECRARGTVGSFGAVRRAMSDPDRPPQALYEAMVRNRFGPRGTRHDAIAQGGADQLGRADRERASVLSTCTRMLRLFRDPVVARNTARSDFRLDDLLNGERPAALYIIPSEAHSQRMRPLLRLFMSMLAKRLLTGNFTGATSQPHRFAGRLIWDEFIEAKRMDAFLADMARLSATGLRTMLLVQDYQQIVDEYGVNEPVTGHCHIQVAYTPSNTKTAEWISEWLGRATVITEDVSESGQVGQGGRGFNRSFHTVSRNLMNPDEVAQVDKPVKDQQGRIVAPGKVFIKVGGSRTALATQALYFFDPVFQGRAAIPAPRSTAAPARAA